MELGFNRTDALTDSDEGMEELTRVFHLCDPLEEEDLAHFFSLLAEIYAIMPQFET